MSPRSWFLVAVTLVAPLACSSDEDHGAPAGSGNASTGGFSHAGTSDDASGVGAGDASADAGAGQALGGEAAGGTANIGHLSGAPPVASGGTNPQPVAAECDAESTWGSPQALAVISTAGADERLLTMTHDELSLVFTRDDALFVADRASAEADFGTPAAVTLPAGYTHDSGLALSPDGLTLVVVSEAGDVFADVSRANRQGGFDGEPSTSRFSAIGYHYAQYGAHVSSPVLSESGESLYFTTIAGDDSLVYHAVGKASFAVPGTSEDMVILGGSEGDLKLTHSVSADERVIFALDEALGHATGFWSSAAGAPYDTVVQVPGLLNAFSNDGCTRLYGTREVGGALDIVIETPK